MYKIKIGQTTSGKKKLIKIEVIDENDAVIEMRTASSPIEKGKIINSLKEFYNVGDVHDPSNSPKKGRKAKPKITPTPVVPYKNPKQLDNYFKKNATEFWKRAMTAISEGMTHKKASVDLFILGDTDQKLTSHKSEWISGLTQAYDYFHSIEAFEQVGMCQALLLKLKHGDE